MTDDQGRQRFGSLIQLKPEYEERYIILHRHTFPDVLKRIHDSNIRNYSIFLRDGMLFSFYEYVGIDHAGDMEMIGADPVTRDWWTLTDPMQVPLESRREGEWWAGMPELLHLEQDERHERGSPGGAQRFACVVHTGISGSLSGKGLRDVIMDRGIQALSLYSKDDRLYVYLEYPGGGEPDKDRADWEAGLARLLESLSPESPCAGWHPMREVFHTD